MANLTAAREDQHADGILLAVPMSAVKLFKGSIVANNASGYAAKGADTASFTLAGIAYETIDNSAGSNGSQNIRVWRQGVFELNFTATATQADVGKLVYMSDDNTVALAATTTNDVAVGRIVQFVSATKVRVELSPV
jgi:hypothetical protein